MVAAVTVCPGFPLQLHAGPTQRAVSCGCGQALLRLPAEGAGNKRRFHWAWQTSLVLTLSRDWMLIVSRVLSCFTKPGSALTSEEKA